MTNGMYPELITRPDIKIFLPPIGGKLDIKIDVSMLNMIELLY